MQRSRAVHRSAAARRTVTGWLVSALVAAPLHAAEQLPGLGDASSGIVSQQVEEKLGQSFLRSIRANVQTTDDALLQYHTELFIYSLAEHSALERRDLSIVIIESAQLNAFAAPGGVIGINLGLFETASNVHEFSAVMAHELAHLSQRHFARGVEQQQMQTIPYLAALLTSVALMATTGSNAGLAALTATQGAMEASSLRFSRAREQEADRLGIDTLANAGLDPHAMAEMFERMSRSARFDRRPPEFLLTHPVTESRVSDARNQAAGLPPSEFEDRLDYQLVRTRVLLHLADSPQKAVAEFEAALATGRTRNETATRYGLALARSAAGDYRGAREMIEPLLRSDPKRIAFQVADGEIQVAGGEAASAIPALQAALDVHTDNVALAVTLAAALNRAGRHSEAQKLLARQSTLRPNDDLMWYLLAEAAGQAGDILALHQARAEYFQLTGDFDRALTHLNYALKRVAVDDFAAFARITQRIDDVAQMQQDRERKG